nr:DoxX family protein [Gammaproteobacteria bacterium]
MNDTLKALFTTRAGYGITLLRVVTGLTFASHGAQKLFGWFGGYGLAGTGQWMESVGLTPGYLMALLIGLLVRPAAFALAIAMLVAVFSVHWANGFFITANGFEYAMILALISLVLLIEGAGRLSLDRRFAG